jgi:hypothetical protein
MARPPPEPPPLQNSYATLDTPQQTNETKSTHAEKYNDTTATLLGPPQHKLRSKTGWKKGFLIKKPTTKQSLKPKRSKSPHSNKTHPASSQNTVRTYKPHRLDQHHQKQQQKGWKKGFLLAPRQTCITSKLSPEEAKQTSKLSNSATASLCNKRKVYTPIQSNKILQSTSYASSEHDQENQVKMNEGQNNSSISSQSNTDPRGTNIEYRNARKATHRFRQRLLLKRNKESSLCALTTTSMTHPNPELKIAPVAPQLHENNATANASATKQNRQQNIMFH